MPTSSVNRVLNVPSDWQPTAKHTSVTLWSPRRSSIIARSIRRVIRYPYGDSPYARLNSRLRCPDDMCAPRASASTSSGWAYSRSIRSFTRRNRARSPRRCASVALLTPKSCHAGATESWLPRSADVAGSVDKELEQHDCHPTQSVRDAGGQCDRPVPALPTSEGDAPTEQLRHADPQREPDRELVLEQTEGTQRQADQAGGRPGDQRPLRAHRRSDGAVIQAAGMAQVMLERVGVHVGHPEHEQCPHGQYEHFARTGLAGTSCDHRHRRNGAVDGAG